MILTFYIVIFHFSAQDACPPREEIGLGLRDLHFTFINMKTNKSFTKRIKVTRKGKIIVKKPGLNHFNAKASTSKKMDKKRSAHFVMTNKDKSRFLPSS